ncbi:MAG: enoyl-CoA hydratase/isomerase family protein [Elusimicrobia bacterium]|nr:enoyl-CoA hydratase/isomerase family protein [Elusimicrobiota bacterium]
MPAAESAAEVLVERDGAVAVLTLNRPKALNALSVPVMKALAAALESAETDEAVRAIVLAGSPRAFAAGADIGEMKDLAGSGEAEAALSEHLARWDKVGRCPKPTIAAVSGFALGGGCELALACDLIVASETAVFGQPEVQIGVIPGAGGTQRLTKAVGKALAMDMVLTGRRLTAREALAAGLVSRVVAPEALLDEAKGLARRIAELAPLAVRAAKAAAAAAADRQLDAGLARERGLFYRLFDTADQKEGMRAFAEKRPPLFKGK